MQTLLRDHLAVRRTRTFSQNNSSITRKGNNAKQYAQRDYPFLDAFKRKVMLNRAHLINIIKTQQNYKCTYYNS